MRILREAGGIDGGTALDVNVHVPEDIRSEPSLAAIKTVQDLAKGYVHAQKLIGAKRIALPGEKATEAEWNQFYDSVGRPATFDKYTLPEMKDMDPDLKVDDKLKEATFKKFHSIGLTPKQANEVMSLYMQNMNDGLKLSKTTGANSSAAAETALKSEWGDKYTANVDIAQGAIKKFGGDQAGEVLEFLNKSGMGNNVPLIKLFHKIGLTVMEDNQRAGGGQGLELTDQTRALAEIENLKTDKNFQEAFMSAHHPGHKGAVDRWMNLYKVAHPGKQD